MRLFYYFSQKKATMQPKSISLSFSFKRVFSNAQTADIMFEDDVI